MDVLQLVFWQCRARVADVIQVKRLDAQPGRESMQLALVDAAEAGVRPAARRGGVQPPQRAVDLRHQAGHEARLAVQGHGHQEVAHIPLRPAVDLQALNGGPLAHDVSNPTGELAGREVPRRHELQLDVGRRRGPTADLRAPEARALAGPPRSAGRRRCLAPHQRAGATGGGAQEASLRAHGHRHRRELVGGVEDHGVGEEGVRGGAGVERGT
mmetsp:Transcript_2613/g.8770  ORF Transcript_2613/g.8770 Transcript_2613/m.8770 type:complete len:213 (-) Transcript_2613:738-1376(-)